MGFIYAQEDFTISVGHAKSDTGGPTMTNIGISYNISSLFKKKKQEKNMKYLTIALTTILVMPAFALDILCTGQGNQGELIEIQLDLNARANTVTILNKNPNAPNIIEYFNTLILALRLLS